MNEKQSVEEIAKILSSKVPKETNYNNIKSRKYFSTKTNPSKEDMNMNTIKDSLLYNISLNSISIDNKNESTGSSNKQSKLISLTVRHHRKLCP